MVSVAPYVGGMTYANKKVTHVGQAAYATILLQELAKYP
jgi:hypothetical protein